MANNKDWFVYLIRTASLTLYCGITVDLQRRFEQHSKGHGAKYLRGKAPLKLVWHSDAMTHREAAQTEHEIKSWSKAKKEAFLQTIKNPV